MSREGLRSAILDRNPTYLRRGSGIATRPTLGAACPGPGCGSPRCCRGQLPLSAPESQVCSPQTAGGSPSACQLAASPHQSQLRPSNSDPYRCPAGEANVFRPAPSPDSTRLPQPPACPLPHPPGGCPPAHSRRPTLKGAFIGAGPSQEALGGPAVPPPLPFSSFTVPNSLLLRPALSTPRGTSRHPSPSRCPLLCLWGTCCAAVAAGACPTCVRSPLLERWCSCVPPPIATEQCAPPA